jgi:hypothetical protein
MKPLAVIAVVVLISGITGYVGYSRGFTSAKAQYGPPQTITFDKPVLGMSKAQPIPPDITFDKSPAPPAGFVPVQHHYEFQTRGASIFRFDTTTGEACWMQLSQADSGTPLPHCLAPSQ